MASSSRNRIADTGLTRPFDRGSEASDRQEAAKKGGQKRAADRCPTISNVTRNGQVTTSLSPPFPPLTCPPTRGTYTRERHFVPDEVSVYVCEQHRPVGLEVPRAFWNDVVGRGRFSPGRLEYDGHREACLPLYRPSPTAPLFSMADGQSYRPSTNSNFTRYSTPTKVAGPSLGKAPAGDSTSPRIHLFEPLLPLRRLYLSFILCLVRRCASRVIFRPYSVCKRIRYEENKFEEILEISSCCLASKIFREETGKRNFGRGNLRSKFWQKNIISWSLSLSLGVGGELFSGQNERIKG